MNFFQLSIIATLLVNLVLGFLVFTSSPRRYLNQVFLASSVVTIYWLCCLLFGATAGTPRQLEFWIRQSTIAGGLIPLMMNCVRYAIVTDGARWRSMFKDMTWWLSAFIALVVFSQTHFFLVTATLPTGVQTVGMPVYGPGFPLFIVYLVGTLVALIWKVVVDYRLLVGIRKLEIQFVLLGWIGSLFFAIVFMVTPQLFKNMELAMFLPLSDSFRVVIIAYGIAKSRILDFATVLRRLIAYSLMLIYLTILYYVVWQVTLRLLPDALTSRLMLHHLLATFAVAFSLSPALGRLNAFASTIFLGTQSPDVGELIQRSSRVLSSISTLDELVDAVHLLIKDAVGTDQIRLLMPENGHFVEKSSRMRPAHAPLRIDKADPLVKSVIHYRESIVRDLLSRMKPDPILTIAGERMRELNVHLATGIYSKGGLEGVILLGPRLSGKIYGSLEQQAIEGLCGQLAVSLDNAKLYTEVQNSRLYNDILLDRLVGGVIAVNMSKVVTVFNREAQRITDMKKEEVLNADISVLPAALRDGIEQAFTQGGSRDVDVMLVSRRGKEIPVRYGCTLFHGYTGAELGVLIVFTDQTELKRLEYQIRRTDRLASLGTLAAGMAHEIKNPLVSLKTFSQLLPERYEDPDFRDTFSILLGEEVSRIDRIVNQLLRFARPAKPSLTPIGLHSVVDNTLNLVKQQMRQHNISVIRQYRADPDRILGDGDMLVQAILNFFLNAIDAMGDAGELVVRTEVIQEATNQLDLWGRPVRADRLRLSIIDSGKGISPDDLQHVFDPFFTTKATGTGLGLSVSHGIIQEHNGVIDVESEVGKGTKLHLTFPLLVQEEIKA